MNGSVLIVDDDPVGCLLSQRALERAGCTVEVASDGLQGLERIRAHEFDVIITDIQMPEMDGREMCESMYEEFPDRKPLVIVVTGRAEPEVGEWALEIPGCIFVQKPISVVQLVEQIRRQLGTQE